MLQIEVLYQCINAELQKYHEIIFKSKTPILTSITLQRLISIKYTILCENIS